MVKAGIRIHLCLLEKPRPSACASTVPTAPSLPPPCGGGLFPIAGRDSVPLTPPQHAAKRACLPVGAASSRSQGGSHTGAEAALASPSFTRNSEWPKPMATCTLQVVAGKAGRLLWLKSGAHRGHSPSPGASSGLGTGGREKRQSAAVVRSLDRHMPSASAHPKYHGKTTGKHFNGAPTCSVSAPSSAMHLSGLAELFLPLGP